MAHSPVLLAYECLSVVGGPQELKTADITSQPSALQIVIPVCNLASWSPRGGGQVFPGLV